MHNHPASEPDAENDPKRLPSHFGYEQNDSIAESLGFRDKYVAVSQLDRVAPMIYPENVRSKCYQWTEEDFAKLSSDSTATKVYENGEFEVWRVYGRSIMSLSRITALTKQSSV